MRVALLHSRRSPTSRLAAAALLAGALACGGDTPEEIRIGAIVILSGPGIEGGRATLRGARLALNRANAEGGVVIDGVSHPLALVESDSRRSATMATEGARRLINQERVVALIGLNRSQLAIPVAGLADAARVPLISTGATHPDLTRGRDWVFRMVYLDPFQGEVMAAFSADDLEAERAAVLYDVASAYNRGIAEVFRDRFVEMGGEVVAFESYARGEEDFRDPLRRIREAEPDVLFLPNYEVDLARQVEQVREVGVTATLIGSDSWGTVLLAGVTEAYYSAIWHVDLPSRRSQEAVAEYRRVFREEPQAVSMAAYDVIELLVSIMREAGSADPAVIRDGLMALGSYDGASGRLVFGGRADPGRGAVIVRLGDGTTRLHKVVPPPGEGGG